MKKIYLTPTFQVEKIEIKNTLLTTSGPQAAINIDDDDKVDASELDARSTTFDLWAEE